jgi:hypothetical protein
MACDSDDIIGVQRARGADFHAIEQRASQRPQIAHKDSLIGDKQFNMPLAQSPSIELQLAVWAFANQQ